MHRLKPLLTALFVMAPAVLLGACDHLPKGFSNDRPQLVAQPDKVSAMLADAATRASNALETLAAVEQARTPRVNMAPVDGAPAQLKRAVTINWVGPVEPILSELSNRASYKFTPLGAAPPASIVVSLDVINKPIIDVFRDIGLQLGRRADIKVDANRRTIELRYPAPDGPAIGVSP